MTVPRRDNVPYLTTQQMIEVDRAMMEDVRIDLVQMMENAGRILARLTVDLHDPERASVLVGKGNNGGGGLVAARYLHMMGVETEVVLATTDLPEVPMRRLSTLRALEVPVRNSMHLPDGVIVDALLGYSQSGVPTGRVGDLVDAVQPLAQSAAQHRQQGLVLQRERTCLAQLDTHHQHAVGVLDRDCRDAWLRHHRGEEVTGTDVLDLLLDLG